MSTTVAELSDLPSLSAQRLAEPHLVIKPPKGWSALNLPDVWQFRDLMMELASRDVKLRYKQTMLGPIWIVLQPLLGAGVFTFVFGKVANFQNADIPNYFLFSYAGLLGWNLFNNTLTKTSSCLLGNSHLISKIFFPRLVLPLSIIPSVLLDFVVAGLMMAVMMLVFHVHATAALLLLPVWMLIILMLSLGIGLCTAALAVSYRDVQMLLPVLTQILQFASPVAYALSRVTGPQSLLPQWVKRLYMFNPLAGLLSAFRWSLLPSYNACRPPELWSIFYAAIVGIVVCVFGAYSFKRMERKFADVI